MTETSPALIHPSPCQPSSPILAVFCDEFAPLLLPLSCFRFVLTNMLFIGIRALLHSVMRGYGDHYFLTTAVAWEWRRGSNLDGDAAARRGRRGGAQGLLGSDGR